MLNSTLGGLIKDYRQQKGISQQNIAFALGWKETSRLSRIEQGVTENPSRELIDKIVEALHLNDEEKNSLLLVGNFLPTEKEIEKVKGIVQPILNGWTYPATLLDFSWRVIDQNEANRKAFGLPKEFDLMIMREHLRILDIFFNEDFLKTQKFENEDFEKWKGFISQVILNFKYEQRDRTNERWYIDHIKNLMNNELFRILWSSAKTPEDAGIVVGKFAYKRILQTENPNQFLNFHLFIVPVLKDPRFEVQMLTPADLETFQYYIHPK